jgi:hypothetical protein
MKKLLLLAVLAVAGCGDAWTFDDEREDCKQYLNRARSFTDTVAVISIPIRGSRQNTSCGSLLKIGPGR